MLAKRTLIPTVFAGAIVTALGGCSLQDYDYLGAENGNKDDTKDEETTEEQTTESQTSSNSPDASVTSDTSSATSSSVDTSITIETTSSHEPDASVSSESSSPVVTSSASSSSSTEAVSSTSETSSVVVVTEEPRLPVVVDPSNKFENASFEDGRGAWVPLGNFGLQASTTESRSGEKSLLAQNRNDAWAGPSIDVLHLMDPGATYVMSGWVRTASGNDADFHIVRKAICLSDAGVPETDDSKIYLPLVPSFYGGSSWSQITTPTFSRPDCDLQTLVLYFEGPPPGEAFYVDDVSLVAQ